MHAKQQMHHRTSRNGPGIVDFPEMDSSTPIEELPTKDAVGHFIDMAAEGVQNQELFRQSRQGLNWVRRSIAESKRHQPPPCANFCRVSRLRVIHRSVGYRTVLFGTIGVAVFFPLLWTAANVDDSVVGALQGILVACGVILCADIVVTAVYSPRYLWSFYFFVDIISTVSIVLEWPDLVTNNEVQQINTEITLLRSIRVSRVNRAMRVAKAARMMRLARLLKMMRVQRFTESVTNGAVVVLLLLALSLLLLSISTGDGADVPSWVPVMAASLAQVDYDPVCTITTSQVHAADGCGAVIEPHVLSWLRARARYPSADVAVLYVLADNTTFFNPYLEDLSTNISPAQSSNLLLVEATADRVVTVGIDATMLARTTAVFEMCQAIVLLGVIYWLTVFIRNMTLRFVMGPLGVVLYR